MRPWVKAALAGLAVVAAFAVGFLIGGGDDGGASVGTGSTLGDTGGLEAAEVSTGEYRGEVAVGDLATRSEPTTTGTVATTTTPSVTTTPTPTPAPAPAEPTPATPPPVIEK